MVILARIDCPDILYMCVIHFYRYEKPFWKRQILSIKVSSEIRYIECPIG